ncbi:hypothetical protein Sjap_024352 [Stephania japonica]|uniref:Anaphase-promoting complex subunit 4-like WD40 domain-containing protein n=1 Tax=Stephania japonica TaxID=461633 RepID=A0AAP0EFD9_9MAGN
MAKKKKTESLCAQKYGVPIYGASWVPSQPPSEEETESTQQQKPTRPSLLVFCGGGGEGRSGIPNSLLISQFDFASNTLSPNPVAKLGTNDDLPYRMAVHPGGEGLICSFPKSCRWFEWDEQKSTETPQLGVKSSEKVLAQLEDVGQQLALTFNNDGSILAVGGEDGHLRVFKWPDMDIILDEADAHSTVKDLSFSSDGKLLISLGSGGPPRVWDVESSKAVASLSKENDEIFGLCRFSQTANNGQILYITATRGQGGNIVYWDTKSWKRVGSKQIVKDRITAFNVSSDGELLAFGTNEGDIVIVKSSNMRVHAMVKKAHLVVVTAMMFSPDSRSLVSASLDSSARVTQIEDGQVHNGMSTWVIVFFVLLVILAYFLQTKGAFYP